MSAARRFWLLTVLAAGLLPISVHAADNSPPSPVQVDNGILDALNPNQAGDRPSQPPVILSLPSQRPAQPILTNSDVAAPGAVVPQDANVAPSASATPSAQGSASPVTPPVGATISSVAPAVQLTTHSPAALLNAPVSPLAHIATEEKSNMTKPEPHHAKKPVKTAQERKSRSKSPAIASAVKPSSTPTATVASPLPGVPTAPPIPDDIPNPDYVQHTGPSTVPAAADATAVQFPLTEKIRTERIDPGLAPTAVTPATPMPVTSLPPPKVSLPANFVQPPVAKSASIVTPPAPAKTTSAMPEPAKPAIALTATTVQLAVSHTPPIPKPRPSTLAASPAFIANAREQAAADAVAKAAQPSTPTMPPPTQSAQAPVILRGHSAGPHMPAVPPATVTAEPLDDPLARKLATPDKLQVVKAIDAVTGGTKGPASLVAAPTTTPVAPPAASPVPVRTPAENINTPAQPLPPPSATPPQDANFFSLPYKPGVTAPGAATATVLQSRVLPMLMNHPDWNLEIEAFSGGADKKDSTVARRLALSRALALRSWLLARGIKPQRLDLHAMGAETDHDPDRVDLHFLNSSG